MKIGILVESFPRISETWLVNQIIDLIERGNEVYIFSIYHSKDPFIHQQVKTHHLIERTQYFFNPKGNQLKKILNGVGFMLTNLRNITSQKTKRGLGSILSKKIGPLFGFNYIFLEGMQNLDILHAHFGDMGVFAAKMKRAGFFPKTKIVVSFHGHDIFPYKKELYHKEYAVFHTNADTLLVNSIYSNSLLQSIRPFSNTKIVPVGLSLDYFKPAENYISQPKIRLVFLGRMVYLKGGILMIDIFLKLFPRNPDLELIMIGDGEERNEIENRVKDHALSESIFLKGALSQDQIIDELKKSTIYVYPGLVDPIFKAGDTQGLVVQEAQAMELPVVCSDIGGIKYGMKDGETGFLVKEGDADGFAEKIQILIDDPGLRQKMGKAGREFVKKRFNSKIIGDELMMVYSGTSV